MAVIATVVPTTIGAVVLLSVIFVCSAATVTTHVATVPSGVVAVMLAIPANIPVTIPVDDTVATVGLLDAQLIVGAVNLAVEFG